MQQKDLLRLAMKERIAKMPPKDREIESRVLCKELKNYLGDTPRVITGFVPFKDEPDIKPMLRKLLDAGWTVGLPAHENGAMVFRSVRSLDAVTKNPVTNLTEPMTDNPMLEGADIDLVLVPGRAFTRSGDRMGRGNGGYDLWIGKQRAANPATKYIGLCFECQIVNEVPVEGHDQTLNAVVTARKIYP